MGDRHGAHDRTGEILARNQAKLESVRDNDAGEREVIVHTEQEDWLIRVDNDDREVWVNKEDIVEKVR